MNLRDFALPIIFSTTTHTVSTMAHVLKTRYYFLTFFGNFITTQMHRALISLRMLCYSSFCNGLTCNIHIELIIHTIDYSDLFHSQFSISIYFLSQLMIKSAC